MAVQKKIPESLLKKRERDQKALLAQKESRETQKKHMTQMKKYYLDQGKKFSEELVKEQTTLIKEKRDAKANGSIYVPAEAKFFLVIRIKGINKVPPKEKKILQLFRLRQLHNATFVKNNKATLIMLRRIDPWVTYGFPSHSVIRSLIYKRGYGKLNGQRIPFTSNQVIEQGLGQYGIKCVEDLIHEIYTCGAHFKEANNFLWPFKLRSPKGGIDAKRQPFLNGGDFGLREEFINEFAKRMI